MYFPPNGNKKESNSDLIAFVEGLEERVLYKFCGDATDSDALAEIDNLFVYLVELARRGPEEIHYEDR